MAIKQNNGSQAPDGSLYVTIADGLGNLTPLSTGYANAAGITTLNTSSGNVAAATATATLAAASGKTTYMSGALITGLGATLGSAAVGTITGLAGGTMTFIVPVVAGVLLGNTPLSLNFNPPLPASAPNTAIVVSVPSLGLGNTNSVVNAWGYQL